MLAQALSIGVVPTEDYWQQTAWFEIQGQGWRQVVMTRTEDAQIFGTSSSEVKL